jgi:hypothetical protein
VLQSWFQSKLITVFAGQHASWSEQGYHTQPQVQGLCQDLDANQASSVPGQAQGQVHGQDHQSVQGQVQGQDQMPTEQNHAPVNVQGRMEPDFLNEFRKWYWERYGEDDYELDPYDFPAFLDFFKDLLDIRDAEESA